MGVSIDVCELDFYFGEDKILHGLDFDIPEGSLVSILGPNGSGKTTLLKNICRILRPKAGTILLDGRDIETLTQKHLAKKMAVVPQGHEISFDFNVHDVVLMGRYPYQRPFRSESGLDFEIVEWAMNETETWHLRDRSINQISGGERQRVIIARALAQGPQVLLLDEPISQLDIKHQMNILELCKRLNASQGITIVMTLHDINLAGRYSDTIILMNKGVIEAIDVPEQVLTRENIKKVYGIDVKLLYGDGPIPYIVPMGGGSTC